MLKTNPSNTQRSAIVKMGMQLATAIKETGKEYLLLNRGVNSVENIDLTQVIKNIDFNGNGIQVYPGSNGKVKLRNAINQEYFNNTADTKNILITSGGIAGLDISFQNLQTEQVLLPQFFWGSYVQVLQMRGVKYNTYPSYNYLQENAKKLKNKTVIICDPGNPLGDKYDDEKLVSVIKELNKHNVSVIIDCPYRKLFTDQTDTFFLQIKDLENVIIVESFSKSLGLSGQRIGFIHCNNSKFIEEASLRILYSTNGINAFAQTLVHQLLDSSEGKQAVQHFKSITTEHIAKNIQFLKNNNLLAKELYPDCEPQGIFSVVNKSTEELFQNRIGGVGMNYFTLNPKPEYDKLSRILVSYNHNKFVEFFMPFLSLNGYF